MKSTTTKAKAEKKPRVSRPKYSNLVKPSNMTLEQWQTLLRRDAARKETFGICQTMPFGYYEVSSPISRSVYRVVFRGVGNQWNYCSCMDFRTNQLGTCKHIEAVREWNADKKKTVSRIPPPYSSIYLDYRKGREVKLRIGADHNEAFKKFEAKYFHSDHTLQERAFEHINEILEEARRIDDRFRCYDDALDFIVAKNDAAARKKVLEHLSDDDLDGLLKVRLFPYQREGIRFAFEKGRSIIADEMGLGKTVQAIGTAELLKRMKLVSSVLIVCPTSLKYQWKSEIEKFTESDAVVIEGPADARTRLYRGPEFYKIVSYNAMANDVKLKKSIRTDAVIMDEVQRLKNWNTLIAKAARRIVSDYSVILSGTPLENKLDELYSVMQLVDQYLLGPYYKFKYETTVMEHTGKVISYKNLNKVGKRIKERLIRRRKADIALQLPSRSDSNLFVPMTRQQEVQHQEYSWHVGILVHKWNRMHFLSESDRRRLLLLLSQMRMVCDSTYILDQKTRHDMKVDEAMNIVSNFIEEGDGKVVIFSQWERMTRLVAQELETKGIEYSYLHGGVPSKDRSHLVSDFTNKPECRIFLATDAGSTGLNLQAASLVINLDLPWNPAVLEQRIGRIYRIGQQRRVQVINLVSKMRLETSIEERMIGTLHFKSSLAEGILDGGMDRVTLDDNRLKKLIEEIQPIAQMTKPEECTAVESGFDDGTEEKRDAAANQAEEKRGTAVGDPEETTGGLFNDGEMDEGDTPDDGTAGRKPSGRDSLPDGPATGEDLVRQGISFLDGLVRTLQSPDKTRELVDSLVATDEKTGKTTLQIPVGSKETISTFLNLLGKLMAGK